MSDYSNLFEMLGNASQGQGPGACPPPFPPGPGPCPPPFPPGPGPTPFGGSGIIIWLVILFFLCRGGFGNFGCGNNSTGNCGCGNNFGGPGVYGYDTGCCTTMIPNPCDYTECCNCCGKRVKKCKKQKNYIIETCQCGGNPVATNNCGCGNNGFGFGNGTGFWWIIILVILFCFRGGSGLLGGAPCPPGPPPFPPPKNSCEC